MDDAVILIITQRYDDANGKMSKDQMYEATRGEWTINKDKRKTIKYALAVVRSIVMAVYRVDSWEPADNNKKYQKWRFSGEWADIKIRKQCIGQEVERSRGGSYRYGSLEEFIPNYKN